MSANAVAVDLARYRAVLKESAIKMLLATNPARVAALASPGASIPLVPSEHAAAERCYKVEAVRKGNFGQERCGCAKEPGGNGIEPHCAA